DLGIFKIATLVLSILLICILFYFLLFNKHEHEIVSEEQEIYLSNFGEDEKEESIQEVTQELNPKPNAELNKNDYMQVAKEIKYNTTVSEIVEVIFEKNPNDIEKHYKEQKENYSKKLFELNQESFENKDGVYYFVKDTLRHIPSFKN